MHLLQSWKNSLQLLQPKNFKQFCLLVINNMMSTARILTHRCWPLGIFLLCTLLLRRYTSSGFFAFTHLFFFLLLSRASVEIKDVHYLLTYTKKYFLRYLVIMIILVFLVLGVSLGFSLIVFFTMPGAFKGFIITLSNIEIYRKLLVLSATIYEYAAVGLVMFIVSCVGIVKTLTVLFLLDSDLQPYMKKGLYFGFIKRAVCMVWYNMPIFLLYCLIAWGGIMLEFPLQLYTIDASSKPVMTFVGNIYQFVSMWVGVATLSLLYTKFLYENPRLYVDAK